MTTMVMMMKPLRNTTSTAGDSSFHRWNSPVPYLFGGLAVMMGLIALALLILACSYKKRSSSTEESSSSSNNVNDSDDGRQEKPSTKSVQVLRPEMEPKFVVIMPGDYNPTCLAKPAMPTRQGPDQV
uniref:Protein GLUTAMINE DUMPER 6-like n=1 Tax=Nicotiana tabacum TaxID=4097 RepID=A0A1S3Y4Y3_TOBAC|nr:PREDICTED: protein GLUTAMINE DUMPER 6-like [Nicotiana tabacum]